jgi:predicted HTH transcriptional regulator
LNEEEKISNAVADSICPLFLPNIEIHNSRNKKLLIIKVPHAAGPFYLKKYGEKESTFIRLGSTNRKADLDTINTLKRLSENISFDELPLIKANTDDLDWDLINQLLYKNFDQHYTYWIFKEINLKLLFIIDYCNIPLCLQNKLERLL